MTMPPKQPPEPIEGPLKAFLQCERLLCGFLKAQRNRYRPTAFPRSHANPARSTRLPILPLRGGRGRGPATEEEYEE